MNDNSTKLLEQLSQKMGTTSEYLWRVLIHQAPVSATIILLQIVVIILFGVWLLKVHKRLSQNDCYGDVAEFLMPFACLVWVIFAGNAFFSIKEVINGYLHPEYWALDRIIDALK